MQTNMYDDEPQSIFVFRNPFRFLSRKGRQIGAYVSGDAVINSAKFGGNIRMGFEDWFSGILTTFGMIVINLIDKSHLQGEAFSYAGSGLVWKARLFLFLGFALIAGGFAGSCCVLIIKYIVNLDSAQPYINYGIAGVGQNGLIMLSTIVLWVAQNTQEEYGYNMRI
ncbi:hypothetical protein MFLAVUS_002210 [Mucor flavus]|uniref:Uncharacterized protein n=1 Tax=Mucor flavus TaxID=439312 RepID=A0ABP9YPM0_9FUNG